MKIIKLSLKNFRRFELFTADFHGNLTVLVARNGEGKTSVLDGVAIALGTFIGAFDMGKARHIASTDARYQRSAKGPESEQQYPVEVSAELVLPEKGNVRIARHLTGSKNKTTTKEATLITEYGKELMRQVRGMSEVSLPVVGYYGSGRLWVSHRNVERKAVLSKSRTMGYEDCLTSASNFKQLQQWMRKATLAVLQQQQMSEYSGYALADQIDGIKQSVDKVLQKEGWQQFHYSLTHEELVMHHAYTGLLPVSLLSDGVRAMVSLAADLAWRCAKLNPHLGIEAPLKTSGIVLIDEVDLHLHPAWQQRIIGSLASAFPNLQFIVTTHSPQVLTTVDKENIRLLQNLWDEDAQSWRCEAETPAFQTRGVASYEALARIMGIDPVPDVEEARQMAELRRLTEQGKSASDTARTLRRQLVDHFGADHPEILECDRLARLWEFKKAVHEKREEGA